MPEVIDLCDSDSDEPPAKRSRAAGTWAKKQVKGRKDSSAGGNRGASAAAKDPGMRKKDGGGESSFVEGARHLLSTGFTALARFGSGGGGKVERTETAKVARTETRNTSTQVAPTKTKETATQSEEQPEALPSAAMTASVECALCMDVQTNSIALVPCPHR